MLLVITSGNLTDGRLRLTGGNSYFEGRVEVYYNGQWGTLCDDGWSTTDAAVVCRQLGFGSSGIAFHSAYFGQGLGPIWLDSITCTGSESTLLSCGHLGINVTRSCNSYEIAGVRCHETQGMYVTIIKCMYYLVGIIQRSRGVARHTPYS